MRKSLVRTIANNFIETLVNLGKTDDLSEEEIEAVGKEILSGLDDYDNADSMIDEATAIMDGIAGRKACPECGRVMECDDEETYRCGICGLGWEFNNL